MRHASGKWCITSSYSKTCVFVRPHVNEWPAFSKIFTLESVFEKMRDSVIVFTEYKWTVGEIGGKKMRFQTKTGSRVDGFVLALAGLAISHASCARLRVTDKITPLTTNNKKKSYCRVFDRFLK